MAPHRPKERRARGPRSQQSGRANDRLERARTRQEARRRQLPTGSVVAGIGSFDQSTPCRGCGFNNRQPARLSIRHVPPKRAEFNTTEFTRQPRALYAWSPTPAESLFRRVPRAVPAVVQPRNVVPLVSGCGAGDRQFKRVRPARGQAAGWLPFSADTAAKVLAFSIRPCAQTSPALLDNPALRRATLPRRPRSPCRYRLSPSVEVRRRPTRACEPQRQLLISGRSSPCSAM